MEIKIGDAVMGTDGKLGEVRGFIYDPRQRSVDEMIVKHGLLAASDRLIPLVRIQRVEGDQIYVDFDKARLETLEQFSDDAFKKIGKDFGPATYDIQGSERQNYGMDVTLSTGTGEQATTGLPLQPDDVEYTPQDQRPGLIEKGMPVLDNQGTKIGTLASLAIDNFSGKPVRLTVGGGLGGHDTSIPLDLVQSLGPEGVELNLSKEEWQARERDSGKH